MTSSNGNIFRVTGHLCGEFTGEFPTQRPVTRSFDVYFDLRPNKRLSKQSLGWWFEPLSPLLWRHRNGDYAHGSPSVFVWCCILLRFNLVKFIDVLHSSYSLKRRRLIGIAISIIKLRRTVPVSNLGFLHWHWTVICRGTDTVTLKNMRKYIT